MLKIDFLGNTNLQKNVFEKLVIIAKSKGFNDDIWAKNLKMQHSDLMRVIKGEKFLESNKLVEIVNSIGVSETEFNKILKEEENKLKK